MRGGNLREVACGSLVVWMCVLVGCSTYAHRVSKIRDAFYANDLLAANQQVELALKKRGGEKEVLLLERAMIQLAQGQPAEAERTLRHVRDRLDYLEQKSAAETTLSYLTDDQRRAYAGEDYEKVLLRGLLALTNLMHDGTDAEAYSLQMIAKQEQIIQSGAPPEGPNPKSMYPRVALAPYLQGVLHESNHHDYVDAERNYARVVSWQPDFDAGRADLLRVQDGHHSAPGNGVLYCFVLTGRGPYKVETTETPSSAALLIAGEIVSHAGRQTVPPGVAPVKVPRLMAHRCDVQTILVRVNGQPVGETRPVTDVSTLALTQYDAVYPQIVARAVARRCVKKGVIVGAKEVADMGKGSMPSLALDLAGIAWEATEGADTRCWGLLPDKIQVLRVELPAGTHQLELTPVVGPGSLGHEALTDIEIFDGRNTYVLGIFPGAALVGSLLIGSH